MTLMLRGGYSCSLLLFSTGGVWWRSNATCQIVGSVFDILALVASKLMLPIEILNGIITIPKKQQSARDFVYLIF